MVNKYAMLMLLLTAVSSGVKAQGRSVSVLYSDGSRQVMQMSEIERIEFGNDDGQASVTVVTKDGTAGKHLMSSIDRILLGDNVTDGIDNARADTGSRLKLSADGECIRIDGADGNATVEVFNAAGRTVFSTTCRDGQATIATGRLAAGAYIARIGGSTFKFVIK